MKIYNSKDQLLLDVIVDDSSYRHRVIKGEHNLTLKYSLAEHIELPIGAYCQYQGERYTLERPESFKMKHSRNFEYTVIMEAYQAKARIWKFRNTVDGRLKFPLTARPKEHLQMFIDNMNRRDKGWTVGQCIDDIEHLINYDHDFCWDALGKIAAEFKTEFEIIGKRVSLRKVEYNKSNPLPLAYGCGNGFKAGLGRNNGSDTPPVEILYVQGGTQNIDRSKYGNGELLLPKGQAIAYDGEHFEGETGFNATAARRYVVDEQGLSVRRSDKPLSSLAEDSLDCSTIYPKRVGTISSVVAVDAAKNFYDIIDNSIPVALNFENCLIAGETMTVIFQSGMLAGREFEVKYYHDAKTIKGVQKAARRFEIVPQEIDGITMPNTTFSPRTGDKYAVFKVMLPQAYICDNATKTGAEWDMFKTAVKYLFDNEEQKFTFTGELDGIWAKKDWVNIGGCIVLGGYILFRDERFQKEGVLLRITGIKDYINKPHSPVIEISNKTVSSGFASDLKKLESSEVLMDEYHKEALQFTKRRFRDAKETMSMLEAAMLENFTNNISPIAIQTMQMLVGDESLQFRFVNNHIKPVPVDHKIIFDNATKQLKASAGIMQHLTLGIKFISTNHSVSEYKFWNVNSFTSARLDKATEKYYLYIKASKTNETAEFTLSTKAIKMEEINEYYHFLVGMLGSEYEGERSFTPLYGFTEILPGRITTDKIVSGDGTSYFDMIANALKLGDKLQYNVNGDGRLKLRGTIVQSQSGDESPIGCFRGVFNALCTYYSGDEVTYLINGSYSTYRYINTTPSKGHLPTETAYWTVVAQGQKGDKGQQGEAGRNGIDGKNGRDGAQGAKGDKGERGPQGEKGVQGLQGIQGPRGEQGVAGAVGANGKTSYFHVKYSNFANPTNASQMNETGGDYLGTYVDFTEADSTDPTKYKWVRTKGAQGANGADGIAGKNGVDGKTSYLHIAYSNSADGKQDFDVSNSVGKFYIGTYTDFVQADSTDPTKYKWAQIKGANGRDGKNAYTFMRYSHNNGKSFTPSQLNHITGDTYKEVKGENKTNQIGTQWGFKPLHLGMGYIRAVVEICGNTTNNASMRFQAQTNGGLGSYSVLATEGKNVGNGKYVFYGNCSVPEMSGDGILNMRLDNVNGIVKVIEIQVLSAIEYKIDNLLKPYEQIISGDKISYNEFARGASGNVEQLITFYRDNTDNAFVPGKLYCVEANVKTSGNVKSMEVFIYDNKIKSINRAEYANNVLPDNKWQVIKTYIRLAPHVAADWSHVYVRFDNNGSLNTNPSYLNVEKVRVSCIDDLIGINQANVDCDAWNNVSGTSRTYFTENLPNGVIKGIHVHSAGENGGMFFPGENFVYPDASMDMKFSVYMRSNTAGLQIYQHIEGNNSVTHTLTPEWKRYEVGGQGASRGYALCLYTNKGGDYDVCCPQFMIVRKGEAAPDWIPSIQEEMIGMQQGSYLGIASWDKNFPPLDTQMYQWSKAIGENGKDADYQEYRFAKNGSTTAAPTLNKSMSEPTGWTLEQPVIGKMEYLWATIAKKKADGTLLTPWSEPVRMTPYDGKNGKDGVSPALVYCGVYDPSKTYYGNQYRIDACKYENAYYVCRIDAGEFKGVVPTNTAKWNSFGASFESIATNLLLAEGANIAGWIFRNNRLESQDGAFWLDGIEGKMMAKGGFSGALRAESLFVPFVSIYETRNLKKTDPTNIILSSRSSTLTLPHKDFSFNGMFLNIYIPPRITREAGGSVKGRILCPNKGTIINSINIEEYYAKNIYSNYGGVLQIVNVEGVWVLLNGTDYLTYEKA